MRSNAAAPTAVEIWGAMAARVWNTSTVTFRTRDGSAARMLAGNGVPSVIGTSPPSSPGSRTPITCSTPLTSFVSSAFPYRRPRLDIHGVEAIATRPTPRRPGHHQQHLRALLTQPVEHGRDIVIRTAIDQRARLAVGGIVVDGHVRLGRPRRRFSGSIKPTRPARHGCTAAFTLAFILKLHVPGPSRHRRLFSPCDAFLFLQGLETLPLRIHSDALVTDCLENNLRSPRVGYCRP